MSEINDIFVVTEKNIINRWNSINIYQLYMSQHVPINFIKVSLNVNNVRVGGHTIHYIDYKQVTSSFYVKFNWKKQYLYKFFQEWIICSYSVVYTQKSVNYLGQKFKCIMKILIIKNNKILFFMFFLNIWNEKEFV